MFFEVYDSDSPAGDGISVHIIINGGYTDKPIAHVHVASSILVLHSVIYIIHNRMIRVLVLALNIDRNIMIVCKRTITRSS